ncbi:MAG: hypothetical protein H6741_08030 [Alphaproteobacteria bacterium]|nr:hypothetical protein [Alphaproteobacteria bacterium]MCB9792665.1 hypothetical protein [Alphaproteobacteria bacterium]
MLRTPLLLGLGLASGLFLGCGEKDVDDTSGTDDSSVSDDTSGSDDTGTATEDCSNGADDDGDGATDCDDSDCAADEACQATEDCAAAGDEDGDGAADCADSDCAAEASCACLDGGALGNALGESIATGDASGFTNDFEGECGSSSGGGLDTAFAWTAPESACYNINTYGSGYDTVLRLFDACGGTEQACNDDSESSDGLQSEIQAVAAAGETWVIVVDAYSDSSLSEDTGFDTGAAFDPTYHLNIEPLRFDPEDHPTADAELADSTGDAVATGNNDESTSSAELSCTSNTDATWTWSWTAPSTATYQIDSVNSDFDTVLGVFGPPADPMACVNGGELACNDDFDGLQSGVIIDVIAGESYYITVMGYGGGTGNIVVNINEVTE